MDKAKALEKICEEIRHCMVCKREGAGKPVPGEGNPDADIVFIGEAPGKEEAKTGRPFVGRSGKFLRAMITRIGLNVAEVFITSPVYYFPDRGILSRKLVVHGAVHLLKQLDVIAPRIIVLMGNTACMALLGTNMAIANDHGKVIEQNGRKYLITFHPAHAMRFPEGREKFIEDFSTLQRMVNP